MSEPYPSAGFAAFAATADAVGATTKRLQKTAILADYLAGLGDGDLAIACRFLSGDPFPLKDERTLQLGYSAIFGVLVELSGVEAKMLGDLAVKLGDIGDVAEQAMQQHTRPGESLTLAEVMVSYEQIASASGKGGPAQKAAILREMLQRAAPIEAKYLLKIITGELRTGLKESLVEEALARLAGVKTAQLQYANMLLGDIGAVALLARAGRLGEAAMSLFHPIKFMLASPVEKPSDVLKVAEPSVFIEDKYDGVRAQAHKQGGRVELYSRTLDTVTHRFPEVVAELVALEGDFIIDGEVLGYAGGVFLPFSALQKRLGRKQVDNELLASVPVIYACFDLLYQNGEVLLDRPHRERRARLDALLQGAKGQIMAGVLYDVPREQLGEQAEALDRYFVESRARGNEGLMVKMPSASYTPGKRGKTWLKVKKALATLDVVVTAVEWGNGRRHTVLSDYTFAVRSGDQLLTVGKAYSGLTDVEIVELTEWFKAHTITTYGNGKVHIVEPQVVIEVAFDRVQPSPRHKSGYALRFPRIVRLRDDKPVAEINTLDDVRHLAENQA